MKYKITEDCVGCGTCQTECPGDAIVEKGDRYEILPDRCNGCRICVEVCPAEAIAEQQDG